MKKKMFLASAVCSLSLLFSTVAYAYGSWTNETQTFPAYMGVIHSSSQPKHFSDGAAKAIKWSGPDINICAMYNGTQVGSGATVYANTYSYSTYYSNPSQYIDKQIYLLMNTSVSYSSNKVVTYSWSPDQPNQ